MRMMIAPFFHKDLDWQPLFFIIFLQQSPIFIIRHNGIAIPRHQHDGDLILRQNVHFVNGMFSVTEHFHQRSARKTIVFFKGDQEWGTSVAVHIWKGSTNLTGNWPGQRAEHLGGGTFKFVIPETMTGDGSDWQIIWTIMVVASKLLI